LIRAHFIKLAHKIICNLSSKRLIEQTLPKKENNEATIPFIFCLRYFKVKNGCVEHLHKRFNAKFDHITTGKTQEEEDTKKLSPEDSF